MMIRPKLLFGLMALALIAASAAHAQDDRNFRDEPANKNIRPALDRPDDFAGGKTVNESAPQRAPDPFLSLAMDINFAWDVASNEVPGRRADAYSLAIAFGGRGRYGQEFSNTVAGFIEFGAGVKLGAMDAEIEDVRPFFHNDSLSGLSYGANFELGAGFAIGPFSFSGGLAANTVGAILEDAPGVYTDLNNDGIYEREDFTLDFGYWGAYLEASLTSGAPGSLGGNGVAVRFYPSFNYNFREGEFSTQAYSVRAQFGAGSIGSTSSWLFSTSTTVFAEFGRVLDEHNQAPENYWVKFGISFAFDS